MRTRKFQEGFTALVIHGRKAEQAPAQLGDSTHTPNKSFATRSSRQYPVAPSPSLSANLTTGSLEDEMATAFHNRARTSLMICFCSVLSYEKFREN